MPIYEYQCTGCHHQLDLLQKVNEPPVTTCPQCAKETLVRLVSAPGFQLKGTGWYATDFKDKGKPAPTVSAGEDTAPPKTTEPSTVTSPSAPTKDTSD